MRATAGEANHNHVVVQKLKKEGDSTMIWYLLASALSARTHAPARVFFRTFNEIPEARGRSSDYFGPLLDVRPCAAGGSRHARIARPIRLCFHTLRQSANKKIP
jgi:hypothetical protein